MSDLADRLTALFATMDQLIELLESENKALVQRRPQDVASGVDRKLMLTRTFEAQMRRCADLKSELASLPPALRQQVLARSETFRKTAAANEVALDAARRAAERVVGYIIEAVRTQTAPPTIRYARPTPVPQRAPTRLLSVSLNQVF
jgi:hypothetical protein